MKNRTRRVSHGLMFPRFAACALTLAAICFLPPSARSGALENGASAHGAAAADQALSPSPAFSFSASMLPISKRTPNQPHGSHRVRELRYGPRFKAMLSGDVGYGFATGDWYDGITSGFAAEGAVRLGISRDFFLGFSYKHQWLGVEDSHKELCYYDEFGDYRCDPLDWDVALNEYYFIFGWMTPVLTYEAPFAYLEVGIGGIEHDMSLGASTSDEFASAETDDTKFGMLFAVGGVFPFSKEIGLNLEADMRVTGEGDEYYPCEPCGYYSGSTGFLFGFKVGLVVMFGSGR